MEKVKILYVVCGLINGGVESFLYNYLSKMNLNNFEVDIITHGKSAINCEEKFKELGCNIYEVPPKKQNLGKNIKEMNKIMKDKKYDIIHVNMTSYNFIPLIIAKRNKINFRISHSHLNIDSKKIVKKLYYKMINWLSTIFATNYMACTDDAAIFLFGEKNFKKGKVCILKNAINLDKFNYDMEQRKILRKKYNINKDELCLCNVGRCTEQKNQMFLLDIFNKMYSISKKTKLIIVGDGNLRNKIQEKISKLESSNNIIFLHSMNEIEEVYQVSDVFVFPSLYEGLGIVLIEAQAMGLKCVISDTIPNEVKITDNVIFLNLKEKEEVWIDKIKESSERKNYKEDIIKNGYSITEEAQKLEDYYMKLK